MSHKTHKATLKSNLMAVAGMAVFLTFVLAVIITSTGTTLSFWLSYWSVTVLPLTLVFTLMAIQDAKIDPAIRAIVRARSIINVR